MLQELMDDEGELRDMNLSSRPGREEKRRVRERDRLEREMERSELHSALLPLASARTACTALQPAALHAAIASHLCRLR